MRLRQLTGLEMDKLRNEYEEVMKLIQHLNDILNNDHVCRQVMKDELIEIRDKYGDERRTTINMISGDFNAEVNHHNPLQRVTLSLDQVRAECEAIRRLGPFENLLIVSGEFPSLNGPEYLEKVLQTARPYFHNLSIEVMPMKQRDYERLVRSGLNGVVCFQETYHEERYKDYHPRGMKSIFEWRVNGFDRMGAAGLHKIGMGVLIGLEDWRTDVTMMARHLRYLRKQYWRTRFSINFPRMCPAEGGYQPKVVMTDKELAQLTFAFRIFDHDVDISYSTRENPAFRANMMQLGVTSMSAGSKTEPGGYVSTPEALEQFEVSDSRTPMQVAAEIAALGYEPVWKDWDRRYDDA